jgi:hypothetical protein
MGIERKIGVTVAVLGSLLLAVSGAIPALARSGSAAGLSRPTGFGLADVANTTSTSFGGWIFRSKAATSVTAEFKVPTLKCTTTTSGVGPIVAMTTGTSTAENFNTAGLRLQCLDGKGAGAPVVRVDGTVTVGSNTVAAGDLIQSTVTTSASKTTATVMDLTTGHTFKLTKSGKGAAALSEAIIDDALVSETTGKQLPVADFGKITFSAGAVSGKAIGSVTPRVAVIMQTKAKVVQIRVGRIIGAKKNAFVTAWAHS